MLLEPLDLADLFRQAEALVKMKVLLLGCYLLDPLYVPQN